VEEYPQKVKPKSELEDFDPLSFSKLVGEYPQKVEPKSEIDGRYKNGHAHYIIRPSTLFVRGRLA
jgi:hypothetical protein